MDTGQSVIEYKDNGQLKEDFSKLCELIQGLPLYIEIDGPVASVGTCLFISRCERIGILTTYDDSGKDRKPDESVIFHSCTSETPPMLSIGLPESMDGDKVIHRSVSIDLKLLYEELLNHPLQTESLLSGRIDSELNKLEDAMKIKYNAVLCGIHYLWYRDDVWSRCPLCMNDELRIRESKLIKCSIHDVWYEQTPDLEDCPVCVEDKEQAA